MHPVESYRSGGVGLDAKINTRFYRAHARGHTPQGWK